MREGEKEWTGRGREFGEGVAEGKFGFGEQETEEGNEHALVRKLPWVFDDDEEEEEGLNLRLFLGGRMGR